MRVGGGDLDGFDPMCVRARLGKRPAMSPICWEIRMMMMMTMTIDDCCITLPPPSRHPGRTEWSQLFSQHFGVPFSFAGPPPFFVRLGPQKLSQNYRKLFGSTGVTVEGLVRMKRSIGHSLISLQEPPGQTTGAHRLKEMAKSGELFCLAFNVNDCVKKSECDNCIVAGTHCQTVSCVLRMW